MDLSKPDNLIDLQEPIQMPVSELLTGNYHFLIPSYQRGYRWESKVNDNDLEVRQVDDLLNDLMYFVESNQNSKANYYLQPLMVKPRRDDNGDLVWDVLDGQQRLTSLLLLLKCLNEKIPFFKRPLYTISYANRPEIDFSKITYDKGSPDYDYPKSNQNLDSFFIRKAKDRIEKWYETELEGDITYSTKLGEALFQEDNTRNPKYNPNLRVYFIWYNAEPLMKSVDTGSVANDIAIFNRLNGGKISLTDSELLKALFLLCVKNDRMNGGHSMLDEETLVRKWDEMERKFQDNEFWNMLSPKKRVYENRLDFLFDFIREGDPNTSISSSYRYYYNEMKSLLTSPDSDTLSMKWEDVKSHYDILCKWHENTTMHNYIGFLVECGMSAASILKAIKKEKGSVIKVVKKKIVDCVNIKKDELAELRYDTHYETIRKILLLFNVEVSEKHREKFSFEQYKDREYDIEHINSQTDNAIVKPDERIAWVEDQALASLSEDFERLTEGHGDYDNVKMLKQQGEELLEKGDSMSQTAFNNYRERVEAYYAHGNTGSAYEKDWIGNLALLNSTINREYKNALYPQKLRTIKRSDQEGEYIPPCTRYLFMKYYSEINGSTSAFNMMRWNDEDQGAYYNAISNSLKEFLS